MELWKSFCEADLGITLCGDSVCVDPLSGRICIPDYMDSKDSCISGQIFSIHLVAPYICSGLPWKIRLVRGVFLAGAN